MICCVEHVLFASAEAHNKSRVSFYTKTCVSEPCICPTYTANTKQNAHDLGKCKKQILK